METKPLSEVVKFVNSQSSSEFGSRQTVGIVMARDVGEDTITLHSLPKMVYVLDLLQEGDLLLKTNCCGIMPKTDDPYVASLGITVLRCVDYDPVILHAYLNQKNVRQKLLREYCHGSNIQFFIRSELNKFPVPVIPNEERRQHLHDLICRCKDLIRLRAEQARLQQELLDSVIYHELVMGGKKSENQDPVSEIQDNPGAKPGPELPGSV